LVERHLAKVNVAGSSPVSRSALRTRGTWWLVRNGLPWVVHFLFKIAPPPPIPPGGGVFVIEIVVGLAFHDVRACLE
jgi:hypothetical protein